MHPFTQQVTLVRLLLLTEVQTVLRRVRLIWKRARASIRSPDPGRSASGGVAAGQVVANGVAFARDLVNSPGAVITPSTLADQAAELGQRLGLQVTVLDKTRLVGYVGTVVNPDLMTRVETALLTQVGISQTRQE